MMNQQVVDSGSSVIAVPVEDTGLAVGETQVVVEVESLQQQPQSIVTSAPEAGDQLLQQEPKLTPEQEEEIKLRSKYPNPNRPPCSSVFVQKLLHKGVRIVLFYFFNPNRE
jgi:hypothetical protein